MPTKDETWRPARGGGSSDEARETEDHEKTRGRRKEGRKAGAVAADPEGEAPATFSGAFPALFAGRERGGEAGRMDGLSSIEKSEKMLVKEEKKKEFFAEIGKIFE